MSENKSEIESLTKAVEGLTLDIKHSLKKIDGNITQLRWDDFLPKIIPWFGTMIAFVFTAIILNHLSSNTNEAIEFMTKLACTFTLVVSGIICAALMKFNKVGRVFISNGSFNPLTAANGFNIATIIQSCATVLCLYILHSRCHKIKS